MIDRLSSVSVNDVVGCIFPIGHGIIAVGITLSLVELSVLFALLKCLSVRMS